MPDDRARFAAVCAMHANSLFKAVERNAPPRHIRHIRLHLKRVERRPLCPCAEQQRQNARPRAHITDAFAPFRRREIRQQHRVRAKAEAVFALDDPQTAALQIVDAFTRLQFRAHSASISAVNR